MAVTVCGRRRWCRCRTRLLARCRRSVELIRLRQIQRIPAGFVGTNDPIGPKQVKNIHQKDVKSVLETRKGEEYAHC